MNYRKTIAHSITNKVHLELQLGFYLFEMTIAMMVLASLMTLGAKQAGKNIQLIADQATAYHFQAIHEAAHQYVLDNFNTFNKASSSINIQDLRNSKYLTEHIKDSNSYKQEYKIVVLQDVSQKNPTVLRLVVATSGGNSIQERAVRNIAGQVGAQAGYVSLINPTKIRGSQGGWEMKVQETGISGLSAGHLASIAVFNEADVMDLNYFKDGMLYRKEMKGHPEYNEMETNLKVIGNKRKLTTEVKPGAIDLTDTNYGDKSYVGTDKFHIENKDSNWTTDIKPAEMRMESKSGARKSYVGNDYFQLERNSGETIWLNSEQVHLGNKNDNWTTDINPSEIHMKSKSSGNKSYVGNDKITLDNSSGDTLTINAYGIKTGINRHFWYATQYDHDMYSEITPEYIKVPRYYLTKGGWAWTKKFSYLCNQNDRSNGRLFVVDEPGATPEMAVCLGGYVKWIKTD